MSCPVCNHTMQNLGAEGQRIFWCQRCGTLKECRGDFESVELPINLRHIITASGIGPCRVNESQHSSVRAEFNVSQFDTEAPRIDMVIYGPGGRRLF